MTNEQLEDANLIKKEIRHLKGILEDLEGVKEIYNTGRSITVTISARNEEDMGIHATVTGEILPMHSLDLVSRSIDNTKVLISTLEDTFNKL